MEKKKQWTENAFWGALLLIALVPRVLFLNWRPAHADEGVTAWFVDQILATGLYKYDPTNFHGPFHYYFQFLIREIFGRDMVVYRLISVFFGLLCVWMVTRFDFLVGKTAVRWAAVFIAVSPVMVFYSRYATQEMDLLFFTMVAFYGYFKDRLWMSLLALVGMMATKETWAISAASFFIAATATHQWKKKTLTFFSVSMAIWVWALLFSGFTKNPRGLLDFFNAFLPWLKTGHTGSGHEKPANYFLVLMYQYEWPALLGVIAALRYFYTKNRTIRFFTLYGVLQLVFYSLISYKTPWCILEIMWPFLIVCGVAAQDLQQKKKSYRKTVPVFMGLIAAISLGQAVNLNFFHYTDEYEPYVYVQTLPEIQNVMTIIDNAVKSDPSILNVSVFVYLHSQWPVPWLLGNFKNAGYYDTYLPPSIDSDIIISDKPRAADLEKMFKKDYYATDLRLRPAMEEITVYFSKNVFEDKLGSQKSKYRTVEKRISK